MQQARTAGWLTPSWNPERKATESKLQENHEAVAALSPLRGKAESLLRLQRLSSRTMHRGKFRFSPKLCFFWNRLSQP